MGVTKPMAELQDIGRGLCRNISGNLTGEHRIDGAASVPNQDRYWELIVRLANLPGVVALKQIHR